ncbi:MAG: CTP synthase [bacterium]
MRSPAAQALPGYASKTTLSLECLLGDCYGPRPSAARVSCVQTGAVPAQIKSSTKAPRIRFYAGLVYFFASATMAINQTKFVFITGGVISSLGKGLTAAAMGALMENRGLRCTFLKLDPYINVDPGTMSPFQHGEVFVTDDGAETDMDLGHYERFTSARMTRNNNFTTGQVYDAVITRERQGGYLGKTVQVIPHITDEIKNRIIAGCKGADIAFVETGGTVGDIESLPFLEAVRQLKHELGPQNSVCVHVTLLPYIKTAGEIKTKPTQHSVKALREIGIQPDFLVCRTELPLDEETKRKLALFCNVEKGHVFEARDAETIYEVPLLLWEQGIDQKLSESLNIWSRASDLGQWQQIVKRIKEPSHKTRIGIVGKYVDLKESYKSLNEALLHGGIANDSKVELKFIDSEKLSKETLNEQLGDCDGLLVPGGFGERGVEGKILAIEFARTKMVPFFGICLGMQMMAVEFARNVCGLKDANSTEFDEKTKNPVIIFMADQKIWTSKARRCGGCLSMSP